MKKQSTIFLILILSLSLIHALSVNIPSATTSTVVITNLSTNSSNFWDNLDDPSDILGSNINNDLGWITNSSADSWMGNYTFYYNKSQVDNNFSLYIPYSGATTNVDLNSRTLTNVGALIIVGLTTSQNITPVTDNLYSIGNSTNWFKEIFVKNIYATDINTTNLIASDVNTNNLDSITTNTTNLTVGGFEVYKDVGGDLNINLD